MTKLRDLPLRYRLSIPFFFLALFGTTSLVGLGILSQNDLIREEERERLFGYDRAFDHYVEVQGRWAVSLASSFARNPEVAAALAHRGRLRLVKLCFPSYMFMKKNYGISQFHFQVVPPRSFLRLHRLYEFGDDLSYRKTIQDALSRGEETFGLEEGLTGYGIRGVAPIAFQGEVVGTVEIGFSFGLVFLQGIKKQFGIEASLLVPNSDQTIFSSSPTTFHEPFQREDPDYVQVFQDGVPQLLIRQIGGIPYAILLRTVRDYDGRTVALVEFCVNRAKTLSVTDHYRRLMLGIGILGLLLSVWAIYVISDFFTRPIGKMVNFAREIALGQKVHPLHARPSGELKVLAAALDEMLLSLEDSREKIQDYTDNLEHMVHLRTRALRESEEKFRTLVENVPLVVYRLLGDGRTVFINHFVEDLIGLPTHLALEDRGFWKGKVFEEDRNRIWPLMDLCLEEGREFKEEYRIRHSNGKILFVMDHALPVFDENGQVETVDGFLVNVTDRHRLQRQILQTEELRTLSEVSARLAHEIRNPLAAAGGFARRLLSCLREDDPNRDKVQIIVQEVARLEKILETTLAYLKPFEIILEKSSLNDILKNVLGDHEGAFKQRGVSIDLSLMSNLPPISLDELLFRKVLDSVLMALAGYCSRGGRLELKTYLGENAIHLEMLAHEVQLSEDDIEHFFYPFMSREDTSKSLDLPLAKMIIHKHRGLIHLARKDHDQLVLNISLPF